MRRRRANARQGRKCEKSPRRPVLGISGSTPDCLRQSGVLVTDSAFSTPRGDEKVLLQKSTLFGETAYKNGRNSIKGYAHFALRLYYFDFFLRAIFVHTPVSTAARITAPIAHGTATLAAGGRYPLSC